MQVKSFSPIFFGYTRSFWFGLAPAALTLLDVVMSAATDGAMTPVASSIAVVLGWVFGWTAEEILSVMKVLAPIYAFIVAQQRAGITRPYAATPAAAQSAPEAILIKNVAPIAAAAVGEQVRAAVTAAGGASAERSEAGA